MGILLIPIHKVYITKWYVIIALLGGKSLFFSMSVNDRPEVNSTESVIAKLLVNVLLRFAIL